MEWNLANILTITRLLLLPFIIGLLFMPWSWSWVSWLALLLYTLGAITDFLDGYVARKYNQITPFGTFLDPISDKIFVISILLMLVASERILPIFVLAVIVIIMREFLVAGLREFLGSKEVKLPVTNLAKWKTTVQMAATGLLIIAPIGLLAQISGHILLCIAAFLTALTGWQYLKASAHHILKS